MSGRASGGLAGYLEASACTRDEAVAVTAPDGRTISYRKLDALASRLRDRLWALGVRPGDRVGFRLPKGIDSLATIFGILKCGAAYVPVDSDSPAARCAYILNDCAVKVVLTAEHIADPLRQEMLALGAHPEILALGDPSGGIPLDALLDRLEREAPTPVVPTVDVRPDDIAYLLYTSGSTGKPKGVILSHLNAMSFVDWCSATFNPTSDDVFSSHAPFHFDLSILDIYVAIKHGARLVLIGEALGKEPMQLASAIATQGITIWYSTPSILNLLANFGKLERHDFAALRLVLFAGEVFPIPQFRALRAAWSHPRYLNLYGPTETNVCTFFEVPADDSWAEMATFPIGQVCPPNRVRVADPEYRPVAPGIEGELLVTGPNVMSGYWNLEERNAAAFHIDGDGTKWYRTGDIVTEEANGVFRYLGRRDRMVKRRGYRVELGEIEAGLARHPDIREVAVVALPDESAGMQIVAVVSGREGVRVSIIALKQFAVNALPPYMAPDAFIIVEALPRTSTDKADLQALKQLAEARRSDKTV